MSSNERKCPEGKLFPDPLLRQVVEGLLEGKPLPVDALQSFGVGGGLDAKALDPWREERAEEGELRDRRLALHRALKDAMTATRREGHGHPTAWRGTVTGLVELEYALAVLFMEDVRQQGRGKIVVVDDQPDLAWTMLGRRSKPRKPKPKHEPFDVVMLEPKNVTTEGLVKQIGSMMDESPHSPLALVLDLHFGEASRSSGLELLHALRPPGPDLTASLMSEVPLLVMSSFRDDLTIGEAFWRGSDGYIVKPIAGKAFRGFIDHPEPLFWICLGDMLFAREELLCHWMAVCKKLQQLCSRVQEMSTDGSRVAPTPNGDKCLSGLRPLPMGLQWILNLIRPVAMATDELEQTTDGKRWSWPEVHRALGQAQAALREMENLCSFRWRDPAKDLDEQVGAAMRSSYRQIDAILSTIVSAPGHGSASL